VGDNFIGFFLIDEGGESVGREVERGDGGECVVDNTAFGGQHVGERDGEVFSMSGEAVSVFKEMLDAFIVVGATFPFGAAGLGLMKHGSHFVDEIVGDRPRQKFVIRRWIA
jgi:hypothetical protein